VREKRKSLGIYCLPFPAALVIKPQFSSYEIGKFKGEDGNWIAKEITSGYYISTQRENHPGKTLGNKLYKQKMSSEIRKCRYAGRTKENV
jgi:hypothetical protein